MASGAPINNGPEFALIPLSVMRDPHLLPAAKLLFARLKLFAGKDGICHPSHETLAGEIAVKPRQIRNLLGQLRQYGYVDWKRTKRDTCNYVIQERHSSAAESGNAVPHRVALQCLQKDVSLKEGNSSSSGISSSSEPRKKKEKRMISFQYQIDDDEAARKRAPKRPFLENPIDEFRARMDERHGGTVDAVAILESIMQQLPNADAFKAFLQFEEKMTTKPNALRNPAGYYRDLVPKFIARNTTASQIEYRDYRRSLDAEAAKPEEPAPLCTLGLCSGNGERHDPKGLIYACECEAGQRKSPRELKCFEEFNAALERQGAA